MILCNLAVILAERKLKISKVAADTGISRTTLTALYHGSGKGVQFDTANMLCIYLGVTVGELFATVPFDLFVEKCIVSCHLETEEVSLVQFECKYIDQKNTEYPYIRAVLRQHAKHKHERILELQELQPDNSETENHLLTELFHNLPHAGIHGLKCRFENAFFEKYLSIYKEPPMFSIDIEIPDTFVCGTPDTDQEEV